MRLALALMALGPCTSRTGAQAVYPQGSAFPLQLYSLQPDNDVALVAPDGWNIGHRYGWANGSAGTDDLNALLQNLAQAGLQGLPALPASGDISSGRTEWAESDLATWIGALAANTNIAYWDLPEELRYWKPDEYQVVQDYTAWTRTYGSLQRPNYMYIPTSPASAAVTTLWRGRTTDCGTGLPTKFRLSFEPLFQAISELEIGEMSKVGIQAFTQNLNAPFAVFR